jgi:hypothetical protein
MNTVLGLGEEVEPLLRHLARTCAGRLDAAERFLAVERVYWDEEVDVVVVENWFEELKGLAPR